MFKEPYEWQFFDLSLGGSKDVNEKNLEEPASPLLETNVEGDVSC